MNSQFTPIPGTHVAINWATIPAEYQFVTVDFSGWCSAWKERPRPGNSIWAYGGSTFDVFENINNDQKFQNWKTLIFERPEQ